MLLNYIQGQVLLQSYSVILRGRDMEKFSMGMSTATVSVSVKKEHSESDLKSIKRFIDALLERKKRSKND